MTEARQHWDAVYRAKDDTQVSWFQKTPVLSLALIRQAAPERFASIIDVGGGTSRHVDALLNAGYEDVTVLDVSPAALARSQQRLGAAAARVNWLVADLTDWRPGRTWQVWHDRAVFHFLTDKTSQDAYIAALEAATESGAAVIIATFAPDGPERCSGLPVQRYSAESLAARLGAQFRLIDQRLEDHLTPTGAVQKFQYAAFRRC
jgi:trans-aconitate methyltransferase